MHCHHANAAEPQPCIASIDMSGINMSVSQLRHIAIASMDDGESATHGRDLHQHPNAAADPRPLIVIIDMSGIDMSLSQPQHILMASMDQGNTLAQSRCAEHMSSTAHD